MAFWFGAAAAAALLAFRFAAVERYYLTLTTGPLWAACLIFEAPFGGLAALLVRGGPIGPVDRHVQWIVAGAFAPYLVRRIRFGDRASGDRLVIDLKEGYDYIAVPLEEDLRDRSHAAASVANDRLAKKILERGGTPGGLADRVATTIVTSKTLAPKWADAAFVLRTARGGADDRNKLRVIIATARDLRMLRVVKRYARTD